MCDDCDKYRTRAEFWRGESLRRSEELVELRESLALLARQIARRIDDHPEDVKIGGTE